MQITDSSTNGLLTWKGWMLLLVPIAMIGLAVDILPL